MGFSDAIIVNKRYLVACLIVGTCLFQSDTRIDTRICTANIFFLHRKR